MVIHYVDFDSPGILFPETTTRKVRSRIPTRLKNVPEGTYAISFWDREELTFGGDKLVGKAKNHSKRILFGQARTLEQVAESHGENCILYRNLKRSSSGTPVLCIMGNWQPLQDGEILLTDYSQLRTLKEPI